MSLLPKETIEWKSFKRLSWVSFVGLLVLFVFAKIYRPLLVSLVLSCIVAYIFDPLISIFTNYMSLRRRVVVAYLIGMVVLTISVSAFLIFPFMYDELVDIIDRLPYALGYIEELFSPAILWLKRSRIFPEEAIESGYRHLGLLENFTPSRASLKEIFSQSSLLIDLVFNILMFPLFTYALLGEKEKVIENVHRWIPVDVLPLVRIFARRVDTVLRAVIKGQFLVAIVLSIFYMLGFSLIGVPSGFARPERVRGRFGGGGGVQPFQQGAHGQHYDIPQRGGVYHDHRLRRRGAA